MIELSRQSGKKIECLLCPHFCKLESGKTGICGARKNTGEKIELMTYGIISGYSLDPVEKKPLYHFFPGHNILSVGSYGCNMRCDFCQNYHISQNIPERTKGDSPLSGLIEKVCTSYRNIGLAFTYNEPAIWFEYIMDTASVVKERGLYTVIVTNGYINPDPLKEVIRVTDAFNVDLKAFNDSFYRKVTGATLEPVKETLKMIIKGGRHLEITTLLIPGQNDDSGEMEKQVRWIAGELGEDVPFHLSKYFPMYKREDPPTSEDTLMSHFEIARKYLNYVYLGNSRTEDGQETKCRNCGSVITNRSGYHIRHTGTVDGKCSACGKEVYKYFTFSLQ